LTFEPYEPGKSPQLRKVLPPDVVWLAMMHRLSSSALTRGIDSETDLPIRFDHHGSFEMRYNRYRRWDENGNGKPLPYRGEVEK
jgi:hypothetical protein